MPAKTTITIRKGSQNDWNNSNPVLEQGELVFVNDSNNIAIGDGTSGYRFLPRMSFDGGDLDE